MLADPMMAQYTGTSAFLDPTAAAISSTAPIPSVIPDIPTYERIGRGGMATLWILFILMLLSTVAFIGMAWRIPVEKRLFHVLIAFITTFSTLSYFSMATGDGWSFAHFVETERHAHADPTHHGIFRQVFWAHHVEWALTTPLIVLNLAFLAGLSGAGIIIATVSDIIMILTGLFATFGEHNGQKWGYYVIAWLAYLAVVYQLGVAGRRTVAAKGTATARFFFAIGCFTVIIWTLHLVVWALGDGRKLSVDQEIICYAVLDVLLVPVFGFWLLISYARNAEPVSVEGFWSHGLNREGAVRLDDDDRA